MHTTLSYELDVRGNKIEQKLAHWDTCCFRWCAIKNASKVFITDNKIITTKKVKYTKKWKINKKKKCLHNYKIIQPICSHAIRTSPLKNYSSPLVTRVYRISVRKIVNAVLT